MYQYSDKIYKSRSHSVKFIDSQARSVYQYKNLRIKVLKFCADIFFNRQCLAKKKSSVMCLDCIYYITVLIYCCVLTVCNTLYKFVNTQWDGFRQKKLGCLDIFSKNPQIPNFMKIRQGRTELFQTDRQRDGQT